MLQFWTIRMKGKTTPDLSVLGTATFYTTHACAARQLAQYCGHVQDLYEVVLFTLTETPAK